MHSKPLFHFPSCPVAKYGVPLHSLHRATCLHATSKVFKNFSIVSTVERTLPSPWQGFLMAFPIFAPEPVDNPIFLNFNIQL